MRCKMKHDTLKRVETIFILLKYMIFQTAEDAAARWTGHDKKG
jgi:hypothetical protein